MIYGDYAITALPFEEDSVLRRLALYVHAFLSGYFDSMADTVDFLTAKGAVLTVLSVQFAESKTWSINSRLPPKCPALVLRKRFAGIVQAV